jgi:selenocysteine lyase/cysteine desulfurase
MANPETGGVDTAEILQHIDKNTCLLSVMSASNISGNILNLEEIVAEARKIKPDLYIITDAVQHMPHAVLDVEKCQLDGLTFAPYKAFGIRGCGYGYVSDRVAKLPHHKLSAKPETEWELGTFPHPNFAAISAVVDYVCWIGEHFTGSKDRRTLYTAGMNRIRLQERALLNRMLEGTSEIPGLRFIKGVKVFLDSPELVGRDLIAAIGIDGLGHKEAVVEYYKHGVTVFERVNTSLYSKRIVESLGLNGAIRVSPLHCHDAGDIDEFLKITAQLAADADKLNYKL